MPSTSLFGDNYPYYNYIKTPVDLKMSTKGDLATVGKDIIGLGAYAATLATGGDLNGTWATTVKRPLGNKYFLQSGGKCNDVKTELEVDRYIYVNNVPMGRIPFISSLINANFTDMRGLIPGTIEQLNVFNPVAIIRGLASGSKPDCQELTMQTIDINNNESTETHFVTLADIKDMDNCTFLDKKNPITGEACRETFSNMDQTNTVDPSLKTYGPALPNDLKSQMYFISVGVLGVYIAFKGLQKMKLIPQ
jgi:hypothetical protein